MNRNRWIMACLAVGLLDLHVPVPLIPFLLAPVYAVWVYWHPFTPCGRCNGTGVNRGSTRKLSGACKRCQGKRVTPAFGARRIHRFIRGTRTAASIERERRRKEKLDV